MDYEKIDIIGLQSIMKAERPIFNKFMVHQVVTSMQKNKFGVYNLPCSQHISISLKIYISEIVLRF